MEMKLLREEIPLEVLSSSGQSTATVEGSVALPGGLREEAHVLHAGGYAAVQRAESQPGRVLVDGRVMFHALYTQGSAQRVNALEATADFTHAMELPGATAQSRAQVEAVVERVEASASAGQMSLRATVRITARSMDVCPVDAVTGIFGVDGLEERTKEITLQCTAARGSEEVLLREEFDLPASMSVRDTLYATATAQVSEVTGGEGSMGVSGVVRLEAVHASDADGVPLVITRHTLPFEATVALQGTGGDQLSATPLIRDVAVASQDGGDGSRTLRAEVQLLIEGRSARQEKLTVLDDAYTTTGDTLSLSRETRRAHVADTSVQAAESGKAMLMLPEGTPPIRQVLSAYVTPRLQAHRSTGARLVTEGMLDLTLIATSRVNGELLSVRMEEPFRITFDADAPAPDSIALSVDSVDASALTADRAELRYIMYLCSQGMETADVTLVTDVQQQPAAPEQSRIVLYFAQPGDTLWSLAERYRVTEDSIRRLNPELQDEPQTGQGIVIWHRSPGEPGV